MATSNSKCTVDVRGGERHINVTSHVSKNVSEGKSLQNVPPNQPPLTNTQTKHIPSGTTIKQAMKTIASKSSCNDTPGNIRLPVALPESAEPVYGAPELHSTLRVGHALVKARNKKPNLPQLVDNKLQSPNTHARFKKQTSKEVSIPVAKKVFTDLVSLDVSENQVAKQLEEHLQIKATAVRPPPRPQDPEPQLSDFFNPEDYVTSTKITTAKLYHPFSCVRPRTVQREDYINLSRQLLGSP